MKIFKIKFISCQNFYQKLMFIQCLAQIYTLNLCAINCRIRAALEYCSCVPFFYMRGNNLLQIYKFTNFISKKFEKFSFTFYMIKQSQYAVRKVWFVYLIIRVGFLLGVIVLSLVLQLRIWKML